MRESKYKSLGDHLQKNNLSIITLSYEKIEEVLGFKLVPTAYKREQWWENDENAVGRQCRSWMEVGWRTKDIKLGKTITFYKK